MFDPELNEPPPDPPLIRVRKRGREATNPTAWLLLSGLVMIALVVVGYVSWSGAGAKAAAKKSRKDGPPATFANPGDKRVVKVRREEIADGPEMPPPTGADWLPLFNGKDFTGWTPHLQDATVPVARTSSLSRPTVVWPAPARRAATWRRRTAIETSTCTSISSFPKWGGRSRATAVPASSFAPPPKTRSTPRTCWK